MRKGAVIVETRNIPNLTDIIDRHMEFLGDDWGLMIFAGESNFEYLSECYPNAVYKIGDIHSADKYNELLTASWFWESIPFDKILIFQWDSMLLRKGIDKFLQYDYVGAPWKFQAHGGNGGLSLRTKQAMIDTCNQIHWTPFHGNEDVYFSNYMAKGYMVAPRAVCEEFSCESIYKLGTLGYHAIDKYLTPQQVDTIKNQYKIMKDLEEIYEELCNTPSDINEHLPVLRKFAGKCSHVTEMGVRGVVSTYALLSGRPQKLISYDINYDEKIEIAKHIAKTVGVDFEFIHSDVLKVEIEPTDMLFIDTLHIYTQLKKELELHSDKVSKYIILHDTTTYGDKPEPIDWQTDNIRENYINNDKGLWPAVTEFLAGNKDWFLFCRFHNNNGLTILKRTNL